MSPPVGGVRGLSGIDPNPATGGVQEKDHL